MKVMNVCFVACFMRVWFVHSFVACVFLFFVVVVVVSWVWVNWLVTSSAYLFLCSFLGCIALLH